MSIYDRLMEEFGCAIKAEMGDIAEKEFNQEETPITKGDLNAIARKVAFYLDLD